MENSSRDDFVDSRLITCNGTSQGQLRPKKDMESLQPTAYNLNLIKKEQSTDRTKKKKKRFHRTALHYSELSKSRCEIR